MNCSGQRVASALRGPIDCAQNPAAGVATLALSNALVAAFAHAFRLSSGPLRPLMPAGLSNPTRI